MRRPILTLLALGLASAGCVEDDPAGTFAAVITPTTTMVAVEPEIDIDLDADPAEPIDIPDNALDFTGQTEVVVTVQDNRFEQHIIVIAPGTKVTWLNEGIQPHNVKPAIEGAFAPIETGELDPDATAARTFAEAGDYPYFCSLHGTPRRGHTGRIIVVSP